MPLLLIIFYVRSLGPLIREHPDVCVAHQLDTLPLALIVRWLISNMKVAFDAEDIYSLMIHSNVPSVLPPIIHIVEDRLASQADLLILPSEALKKYLRKDLEMKSLVIMNVPEKGFTRYVGSDAKSELHLAGRIVVIYFGLLTANRGLETLIRAIGILANRGEQAVALIAGDGPLLQKLKQISAFEGLSDKVLFLGRVPRDRVPYILSACDMTAILNTGEDPLSLPANPNKLFESMVCGVPLMVSNFGELARIVKEADCGVTVNPDNPEDVAKTISKLGRDPDLRKRLSENGLRAMSREYSWEPVSHKLVRSIAMLLTLQR